MERSIRPSTDPAVVGAGLASASLDEVPSWEESPRLIELAQSAVPLGFFVYQMGCDRLLGTPGLGRLLGKATQAFESALTLFLELVCSEDRDDLDALIRHATRDGRLAPRSYRVALADGSLRWLSIQLSPGDTHRGGQDVFGVAVDITSLKVAEAKQKVLAESDRAGAQRADMAAQAKEEFLAILGHELRNPLSAISAGIEVLQRRGATDSVVRGAQDIIARQTRHLSYLMTDLLDVTGFPSDKCRLETQVLNFDALLSRVVRGLEFSGAAGPGRISVDSTQLWLHADAARLVQVLHRLIDNALKHTAEDRPVIVRTRAAEGKAVIQVWDSGESLAPSFRPPMFDHLAQERRPLDRYVSGIGLTLVRRLVELQGGTVSAMISAEGNCFEVRLPLAEVPTSASDEGVGATTKRLHVLVIEDNADARKALCEMLALEGHIVSSADDGLTGLGMLLQQRPEIAVIDIGLPRLDGLELSLRARSAGYAGRLIAVSGHALASDAHRALRAGFDAHMAKPIQPEQLHRLMFAD